MLFKQSPDLGDSELARGLWRPGAPTGAGTLRSGPAGSRMPPEPRWSCLGLSHAEVGLLLVYWLNLRPCPASSLRDLWTVSVRRSFLAVALPRLAQAGCDLRRLSPSGAAACGLLCAPCLVACCSLSHSKRRRPCSIVRSKASTAPPKRMRQALCSLSCAQLVLVRSSGRQLCCRPNYIHSQRQLQLTLDCLPAKRYRGFVEGGKTAEHLYCRAKSPRSMHPTLKGAAPLCANSRYASRLPGCRGSPLRS